MSDHNAPHCCCGCHAHNGHARRGGFFSTLFKVALVYVLLVFTGGTLMNFNHPATMQVGHFLHTVTFVQPTIHWAYANNLDVLGHGLEVLAAGAPARGLL